MLPKLLSFAIPLFVYACLGLVVWGLYRERRTLDPLALVLVLLAFLTSLVFRPNEHLLYFDEDIYVQIASNMAHAPVAQLTLVGRPTQIQTSTYYKEPAGFPALLALAFSLTGTSETVAFVLARMLYGLTIGAVYLLARRFLKTRLQAVVAALGFAVAPACFAYSSSSGTDLPAVLFATLGIYGILLDNGALAAGGLAMAAQVRLEMIALAPLILLARQIPLRWKAGLGALLVPEVLHVAWVLSVAQVLAKAERVESAFSPAFVPQNVLANLTYLFNPAVFPLAASVLAVLAAWRARPRSSVLAGWFGLLFGVYLCFYAGSFELNPRYSIQLTVPIVLMAASLSDRRIVLLLLLLGTLLTGIRPWLVPPYLQTLGEDHKTAAKFAQTLGSADAVVATEPEVFMNQGRYAVNAVYAMEHGDRFQDELRKFERMFYYAGVRTTIEGTRQWEADRWIKSTFELSLMDSRQLGGMRMAVYELTQRKD